MLCIQELDSFGYTSLLVSLRPSPLSPCMYIKILNILKKKKKKGIFLVIKNKMACVFCHINRTPYVEKQVTSQTDLGTIYSLTTRQFVTLLIYLNDFHNAINLPPKKKNHILTMLRLGGWQSLCTKGNTERNCHCRTHQWGLGILKPKT